MPGPGPKLPRPETPTIPVQQTVVYKPTLWDKFLEGIMVGAGAYLAVRIIRHFDDGAPSDERALNP